MNVSYTSVYNERKQKDFVHLNKSKVIKTPKCLKSILQKVSGTILFSFKSKKQLLLQVKFYN